VNRESSYLVDALLYYSSGLLISISWAKISTVERPLVRRHEARCLLA